MKDETVQMAGGRLFHARDAATGKAQSLRVDRCTDGTTIATNVGMGLTGANETGERLPDFCLDHQLVLTNRCFTQHSRLYT